MQTRSFCYVYDLVDGLVALMNSPANVTGPINLGNPREFTIRELASLVLTKTQSRSAIEPRPLPQDDPKQRRPDISRARELLNWTPRVSLEDGLDDTIKYFANEAASVAGADGLTPAAYARVAAE
jgi:UDP-glucuronate decarboxylase